MNFAPLSLPNRAPRQAPQNQAFRGHPPASSVIRKLLYASAGALLISSAQAKLFEGNLLKNGTAANPMSDSWVVITSGGDVGWTLQTGGDDVGQVFCTSFSLGNRYQLVDLMPPGSGVTAADLDAMPQITASEHVASSVTYVNGDPDKFYLKAQLLAADKVTVLAEKTYGSTTALMTAPAVFDFVNNASKFSLVFPSGSYTAGARYLRFEDGGYDSGNWRGPYGACFDDARVEFTPDADSDGLPDSWETANGTQVTVADASADPDHDGLTNMQEFLAGTAANNPDTDHDGLLDGVENGTVGGLNSYGSPTATGTLPLNPDSDGDGLLDGVEIPGNPYVDMAHPGTDPTNPDSDYDGATDYREALAGTDPKDPNKFPVYTFTETMKDDFDGHKLNSVTSLSKAGTGGFTPVVTASNDPLHNNVVKLVSSANTGNSNAVAFDQVPANAVAVKFSFDFSMSSGADGIGFGFFKTSDYPATGAINPGSVDSWETPISGVGVKGGVVIGLSGYHNTVMITSPTKPTKALYSGLVTGLQDGLFDRVVVTAVANAPGTTAFSADLIMNVDSPDAYTVNLFSAVVATGFDISTDPYRIVIGGRTGGIAMNAVVDNVVLATNGVIAPPEKPVIMSSSVDRSATPAQFVMTWSSKAASTYKLESSATLTGTWTTLAASVASGGTSTTYKIPLPAGSPPKSFYRITPN